MKAKLCKNNKLQKNIINIINTNKTTITLPICDKLSRLQILFVENEEFIVDGNGKDIILGNYKGKTVSFPVGKLGSDTQPIFIFYPPKEAWYIVTQGYVMFYPEAQNESQLDEKRSNNMMKCIIDHYEEEPPRKCWT